ncbi:hypothetical protein RHSIM_Rhsim10G0202200 [Rhododendron simsii]|uniref:Glycoside hydrolase family 19 catalytic domain-containing protein n=1 Tax=Rhododendron simsii TaxID=118357 RepID=A0A834GFS6_RHOSS|nr:hypothetical protein RHSIM_Rhsim10G0202200 [Rhododendron simsii]
MRILALISLSLLSILGPSAQQDISSLISKAVFENMLKHRNDAACQGKGFYTYEAFIAAAKAFGGFGTTGDDATKKREIAAFLAQTSHETTGGWPTAPDGPYAWGYCFVTEQTNPLPDYCDGNEQQKQQYPCAAGQKYFGRGPIYPTFTPLQLWSSWNSHRKQSTSQPRLDRNRPHHFFQNSPLVLNDPTIPETLQPRCHHRPMDPVGR